MKRLILMRHGKAERSNVGGDFERALTERGLADAALMGRLLADEGLTPDRALVSAARRTQQTWNAVPQAFPPPKAGLPRPLDPARAIQLAAENGLKPDE